MKAIALIGGEATRLRPLTCSTPKAMVPVLNLPFLQHVLRHLLRHGIADVILTQGQVAKSIESYLGDGSQFGVRLVYTIETSPLGTAGAIKNAEKFIDGGFLVLNGDIFTDLDISAVMDFHRRKKAVATIALTPVDDPSSYGVVETDAGGRVLRFVEKPAPGKATSNMINAGTYILEPEVLAEIPPQTKFSFERELFPKLLAQGKPVYAYPSDAYWMDIGTPEKYLQLNRDLLGGKASAESRGGLFGKDVLVGEGSDVHPKARIVGPTVIGPACSIAEGVVVEQSVIWLGARVERGARITGSVVANDCRMGAESVVEMSVLGDHVNVPGGTRLKPGSKIWPGTMVEK